MTLDKELPRNLNAEECIKLSPPLEQFLAWAIMNAKNRGDHDWLKKWQEATRNVPSRKFPTIPTPKGYATDEGWKQ